MNPSGMLYDPLRKIWVAATPEETVRQSVLQQMLDLGYPQGLIVIEAELSSLPHLSQKSFLPARRIDVLCYGAGIHPAYELYPLLAVECKAGKVSHAAMRQLLGYNYHVGACFVALAGRNEISTGFRVKGENDYRFVNRLLSYEELMEPILFSTSAVKKTQIKFGNPLIVAPTVIEEGRSDSQRDEEKGSRPENI